MTWGSLAERDRKALVAGTALVLLIVAVAKGLPTYRAWRGQVHAEAIEPIQELAVARDLVESLVSDGDSLEARRERVVALSQQLVGRSTTGAAKLATRIQTVAESAGAELDGLRLSADSSFGRTFARVTVRGGASGDIRALSHLLANLEAGPPMIQVREWSISQASALLAPGQPEVLRMEFVIDALALREAAPAAADTPRSEVSREQ